MFSAAHLSTNLLACLVVIALTCSSVSCLKCHVCNSYNPGQEDCLDVVSTDSKYLQSCDLPKNASCRTQEQWVEFQILKQSHDKRVIRQCASEFDASRPCYYRSGFGGKTNVCNCLGDGCNSATRTASAIFVTLGTFLFLKMFL